MSSPNLKAWRNLQHGLPGVVGADMYHSDGVLGILGGVLIRQGGLLGGRTRGLKMAMGPRYLIPHGEIPY